MKNIYLTKELLNTSPRMRKLLREIKADIIKRLSRKEYDIERTIKYAMESYHNDVETIYSFLIQWNRLQKDPRNKFPYADGFVDDLTYFQQQVREMWDKMWYGSLTFGFFDLYNEIMSELGE